MIIEKQLKNLIGLFFILLPLNLVGLFSSNASKYYYFYHIISNSVLLFLSIKYELRFFGTRTAIYLLKSKMLSFLLLLNLILGFGLYPFMEADLLNKEYCIIFLISFMLCISIHQFSFHKGAKINSLVDRAKSIYKYQNQVEVIKFKLASKTLASLPLVLYSIKNFQGNGHFLIISTVSYACFFSILSMLLSIVGIYYYLSNNEIKDLKIP